MVERPRELPGITVADIGKIHGKEEMYRLRDVRRKAEYAQLVNVPPSFFQSLFDRLTGGKARPFTAQMITSAVPVSVAAAKAFFEARPRPWRPRNRQLVAKVSRLRRREIARNRDRNRGQAL